MCRPVSKPPRSTTTTLLKAINKIIIKMKDDEAQTERALGRIDPPKIHRTSPRNSAHNDDNNNENSRYRGNYRGGRGERFHDVLFVP